MSSLDELSAFPLNVSGGAATSLIGRYVRQLTDLQAHR